MIQSNLNLAQNQLSNLEKMLESNNPKFKTKKGFAQLSLNSQVIDIESLNVDDIFEVQSDEVIVHAKVISKENIL
jgi:exodeoxyribonuclease VII large subunit